MSHSALRWHRILTTHTLLLLLLMLHVLLIRHMMLLLGRHAIATHGCDGLRVCATGGTQIGCLLGSSGSGGLLLLLGLLGVLGGGVGVFRGRRVGITVHAVGGVGCGFGSIQAGLEGANVRAQGVERSGHEEWERQIRHRRFLEDCSEKDGAQHT